MALGRHNGAPLISKAGTQWIRRVLGDTEDCQGKYLWDSWVPTLFLVLHTVGVFWCHFSLKDLDGICQKESSLKIYLWWQSFQIPSLRSFLGTATCRKTEFTRLLTVRVPTHSREAGRFSRLHMACDSLLPWILRTLYMLWSVSACLPSQPEMRGHLFRWMLTFPGVFSRTSCFGSFQCAILLYVVFL